MPKKKITKITIRATFGPNRIDVLRGCYWSGCEDPNAWPEWIDGEIKSYSMRSGDSDRLNRMLRHKELKISHSHFHIYGLAVVYEPNTV